MNKYFYLITRLLIGLIIATDVIAAGSVLYEQDYESGVMPRSVPDPIWSIRKPSEDNENYGPGNLFEVVSGIAHTGNYSLRFNYDGRNGFCNTCGSQSRSHISGLNGVNYFIDSQGTNLALDPIKASQGRIVYNKTDGFSKWRITSVQNRNSTNDQLNLEPLLGNMGGTGSTFSAGDSVKIMRACGIDGTIGGDINRRSDCNQAITLMGGVAGTQMPGESIFRRVYLMLANGAVIPSNQKLRYWTTVNDTLYMNYTSSPNGHLITAATQHMGGSYDRTNVKIDNNTWYYLEEEFKAETSDAANDGEYRLWIVKSGSQVIAPVIEHVGLDLGVVKDASLWGNHQHSSDSHGYWYMDDIKIAKTRIGPIEGVVAPPNPPIPQ